jgi:LysR family hydrogen peroxide-inducible transcriptional activator
VLFEDPFSAVVKRDHPLALGDALEPAALENETLLLLRDGHCLKDHALSACRMTAKPRHASAFEATSLHTLTQMVDNGLGVTLMPQLALDAHILRGTDLVARPLAEDTPAREIALAWRRGTGRRDEFLILADAIAEEARKAASTARRNR